MGAPKLLLVTDQWSGSEHSAIEGIFVQGVPGMEPVAIVEFCRDLKSPLRNGSRLVLPASCRHRGLAAAISEACPGELWDFVIVRNLASALRQLLASRAVGQRIGLWHSFPHAYRRLHEAEREGRAVIRKRVEYAFRSWRERALVTRCDFLLPITSTMHDEFHHGVSVPWMPLPMGVDPERVRRHRTALGARGSIRVAYCGAMDSLRALDVVLGAVADAGPSVTLDMFGDKAPSHGVGTARALPPSVRMMGRLRREELFDALIEYDAGLALIPDDRLFRVSSPTKSMEYAALGLVPVVTPLPEHKAVFDHDSAIFCSMGRSSIAQALESLSKRTPEDRAQIGSCARARVLQLRNYRLMAGQLSDFLRGLNAARVKPASGASAARL